MPVHPVSSLCLASGPRYKVPSFADLGASIGFFPRLVSFFLSRDWHLFFFL